MRLGIDVSNLRFGGGITHIVEILKCAKPEEYGFSRVVIWGGRETLDKLPQMPWMVPLYEPQLDKGAIFCQYWRRYTLRQQAPHYCDILFLPGGGSIQCSVPYVTMFRNMLPFMLRESVRYGASLTTIRLFLLRLNNLRAFRNADGTIFLGEYAESKIAKTIGCVGGEWAVVPHGIGSNFHLEPREQRQIMEYSITHPFRVLYVSIIDMYKHQWRVVQAIARLRKEGYPVALDLAGPAYRPALKRLRKVIANTDPDGQFIQYHGDVSYDRLPSYYHSADGFVFASTCENMPNILLEAMAAGLPIACSECRPMPDLLRDSGLYFDPDNTNEITDAVRSLIVDPALRAQCARKAFELSKSYSWQRCADETFAFLSKVAKQ